MITVEIRRQAKRRRTLYAFLALVAIPTVVLIALLTNGGPGDRGGQPQLVDVASSSGLNFALFMLLATSQFLLVVVVSLFAGDAVASEGQWGSLRYLLTRPIPRFRLLRTKLVVAALYAGAAVLLVPLVSLAMGTVAFGWSSVQTPLAGALGINTGLSRLALGTGYVVACMAVVVALSFLFSTMTDAPLTAVGGAVVLVVVSEILDQVTALGSIRQGLPTHYWLAWLDLLVDPVDASNMTKGLLEMVPWVVVPLLLAFWNFRRKDVLS
ncbi:MAG: type transport system permease protein [Frankiales bacterium]|nr:type transport system permease protein [Frankiales bacterium]